jgi:O-antigen/teichoic acid export membrane protein
VRNERRILINTVALSAAEGIGQFANLLLIVSFARHFGSAVLGYYSVGMSVGAVAAALIGLGVDALLVRDCSQDPAAGLRRLGILFPVQLLLTPLAWVGATVISIALIGRISPLTIVVAASGYQVLLPLGSLLLAPLRAREQMLLSAGLGVAHRLLSLGLGLLALRLGASADTVAFCFVAGGLLQIVLAWTQTKRVCGRPSLRWAPREALALYREAAPFFGMTTLWVIYTRGTTMLLGAMSASREVGLYAVADRLMVPLALGPAMFNSAVYPALSRLSSQSVAAARDLCGRCIRLLLVATVPLAAFAAIFSRDIIQLFFGSAYLAAAPALQVLAWTLPVRGTQNLLGSQLAAMHRQASVAKARFAGLCAFAVISPLLILMHGYVGAAWALLVCDGVQLALYADALRRVRALPIVSAPILALPASAALTCAAGFLLPIPNLLWRLPVAVLVMSLALWGLGAVKRHDLQFLRTVLAGK